MFLPYKTLKIMKLVLLFQEAGELTHLIPPRWIFFLPAATIFQMKQESFVMSTKNILTTKVL